MHVLEEVVTLQSAFRTSKDRSGVGAAPRSARGGIPFEGDHSAGRQRSRQTAFALLDDRLRLLALGEIDLHVDHADNLALLVEQRRGTGHDGNERAVWPFKEGLPTMNRSAFIEHNLRRTVIERHRATVG